MDKKLEQEPYILIIEDVEMLCAMIASYCIQLGVPHEIAQTLKEAEEIIFSDIFHKFTFIILDASLEPRKTLDSKMGVDTHHLVQIMKARPHFNGLIIANSGRDEFNNILMEAGCDMTSMDDRDPVDPEQSRSDKLRILPLIKKHVEGKI